MDNRKKVYEPVHIALIIIQSILIIVGWSSVSFQLVKDADKMSVIDGSMLVLSCLAYLFIMVYAVWGYKKSIVPYRLAISAYYASLISQVLNEVGKENADITRIVLGLACIGFLVAFDNTFKKRKTPALILGSFLMLSELAISFVRIFIGKEASIRPFSGFILACAILVTYVSRCHWSANGKEDIFEDDDDDVIAG